MDVWTDGSRSTHQPSFLSQGRPSPPDSTDATEAVKVLDPDVAFRVDTGGRPAMAPAILTGSTDVPRHAATYGPRFAKLCSPALVNGGVGIIARVPSGVIAVAGLTVVHGRVSAVDLILDPDKLAVLTID